MNIQNTLKHYLSVNGQQFSIKFNGDPLNNHFLPLNRVGLIYLRDPCFGNDMHSRIFNYFGAMFTDGFFWIDAQKVPIGFAKKDDLSFWVGDHYPVINIVENGFIEADFFVEFIE